VRWALDYEVHAPPLLLLDPRLYGAPLPKAKSVVPGPHARFTGTLEVDGRVVEVDGWPGSQNHNWGERHTDRYAHRPARAVRARWRRGPGRGS